MKKNKLSNKKWYNSAVAILIGVVGYVALTNLDVIAGGVGKVSSYFMPIFMGGVIAYMVNPLAKFIKRTLFKNIKNESVQWMLSVVAGMIVVLLFIMLLLLMLIPQLIESFAVLISNMDGYIAAFEAWIEGWHIPGLDLEAQFDELAASSEELLKTGTQVLSSSLKNILSASRNVGKNVVNFILAIILSIYLLGAKDSIKSTVNRLIKALMPDKLYDRTMVFLARCNNILVRYIIFSILDAVIVGGVTAVFMAVMKMEYIGLISVFCGVTNLIPTFGPMIGFVIGGFILLLINPWHALIFAIFTCILQTLDGYVIKPKLFGDSLGVSGMLIIVSIVVFGNIFGVWGILLAIPLAAIIDFSYEEYLLPYLEERKERLKKEEEKAQIETADGEKE